MSGKGNSTSKGIDRIHVSATVVAGANRRMLAKMRDHEILMDVRQERGGDNAGPTPPECLATALGGCILNLCRILAMQKGIVLENLRVTVDGDIDPSKAFGLNTDARAGFSHLSVRLEAASTLAAAEQEEFRRELLDRCPLCDTIANPVPLQVLFTK
jgi:putative redox protein